MRNLLISSLLISNVAFGSEIKDLIVKVAKEEGVSAPLLSAICWVESGHRIYAYNHADGRANNHAFGICQILLKTAKGIGFKDKDGKCSKDFRKMATFYADWREILPPEESHCELFNPLTNLRLAAKYLKSQLVRYKGSWLAAIAAYNAGSVKSCATGVTTRAKDGSAVATCTKGGLFNSYYVDRVLKALANNN